MENNNERVFYLYKFLFMTIMMEGIGAGYGLTRYFRSTDENKNDLLNYQGKTMAECLEVDGVEKKGLMSRYIADFSVEKVVEAFFEHPDVYEFINKDRAIILISELVGRLMLSGERIVVKKGNNNDSKKMVS